jgi:hypothetical protein
MQSVTVSYLGVAVCADAQLAEGDERGARIATQQPMPVGTDVEITIGDAVRRARVVSVAEVRDAGMRVEYFEPGHTPPPQAAPVEADMAPAPAPVEPAEPAEPTGQPEARPKRRKKKSE